MEKETKNLERERLPSLEPLLVAEARKESMIPFSNETLESPKPLKTFSEKPANDSSQFNFPLSTKSSASPKNEKLSSIFGSLEKSRKELSSFPRFALKQKPLFSGLPTSSFGILNAPELKEATKEAEEEKRPFLVKTGSFSSYTGVFSPEESFRPFSSSNSNLSLSPRKAQRETTQKTWTHTPEDSQTLNLRQKPIFPFKNHTKYLHIFTVPPKTVIYIF